MIMTGVIAIVAVLAGVLLVNLVQSPSGQDTAADDTQTSSPTPTATGGTRQPTTSPGAPPSTTSAAPAPKPTTAAATTPSRAAPPAAPTPSPVFEPVVILNKSTIRGQAEAAVERVEAAGFRVDRVGNFTATYNVPVSTVFYDPGHEAAARTMLDRVPGVEKIIPKSDTNIQSPHPLILVVTRDFPTDLTER
jgi:hypothetical protein